MKQVDIVRFSEGLSSIGTIRLGNKQLIAPTYFPAVSSFGVKHRLRLLYRLLDSCSPLLFVSAYDVYNAAPELSSYIKTLVRKHQKGGGFVFADSGQYEGYWKKDKPWEYENYRDTLQALSFDFYTNFDLFPKDEETLDSYEKRAFSMIMKCESLSKDSQFIPILHAQNPSELVSITKRLVTEFPNLCSIIAVPERDCGGSILQKANTIARIRMELNQRDGDSLLHILGCGNPQSIAIFCYCGANTFDSLDWVRFAIDSEHKTLMDSSYNTLQSCNCKVCSEFTIDKDLDTDFNKYHEWVILHNLQFYQEYMKQIQTAIFENELSNMIEDILSLDMKRKLESIVGST